MYADKSHTNGEHALTAISVTAIHQRRLLVATVVFVPKM